MGRFDVLAKDWNVDDEDDVVTLIDEDGDEVDYEVLGILQVGDMDYAILTPFEFEDDEEGCEIAICYYSQSEDGHEEFISVTDKATYRKVLALAEELFGDASDEA